MKIVESKGSSLRHGALVHVDCAASLHTCLEFILGTYTHELLVLIEDLFLQG